MNSLRKNVLISRFQKRALLSLIILFLSSGQLLAKTTSDWEENLNKAMSSWPSFQRAIKFTNMSFSQEPDSLHYLRGTVLVSGHATSALVEFERTKKKKKKVVRIMIYPPKAFSLSNQDFRNVIGQEYGNLLPGGTQSSISISRMEMEFEQRRKNKIKGASIDLSLGTWSPFVGENAFKISEITARFRFFKMEEKNSESTENKKRNLQVSLVATMVLPKDLTDAMKIGETQIITKGSIDPLNNNFVIQAMLNSDRIPITSNGNVVLKSAKILFANAAGKPKLAMAGTIQVLKGESPVMPDLNGQVSIDLTGTLFGEAWLTNGQKWNNPLGLNKNLTVSSLGLGFGLNFKTTPIPAPIIAMQGGMLIKNPKTGKNFAASGTIGVDFGNPQNCMVDMAVPSIHLRDIFDAFHVNGGAPQAIAKELSHISFQDLRLRYVPKPGIHLFDNYYHPGFLAHGAVRYRSLSGVMYVRIQEGTTEAFGSLSPIKTKGFSMTGTNTSQGPSALISIVPSVQNSAFILNGQLEALGITQKTDIYLSSAGFNFTLKGKVFGAFMTELDLAGGVIDNSAKMYASASMKKESDLAKRIGEIASDEIGKLSRNLSDKLNTAKSNLEKNKPLLAQAEKDLHARQEEARERWRKVCEIINRKEAQQARADAKSAEVDAAKKRWKSLQAKLEQDRWRRAQRLRSTTCAGKSRKGTDLYCYTPRTDYKWSGTSVRGENATFKPRQRLEKDAYKTGN